MLGPVGNRVDVEVSNREEKLSRGWEVVKDGGDHLVSGENGKEKGVSREDEGEQQVSGKHGRDQQVSRGDNRKSQPERQLV